MKEYTKPALTIEQQIEKLKESGLNFNNEEKAAHFLSNISFYSLRAYTYPFQDNEDCNYPFTEEISFEEILDTYIFDRKLRLLDFNAIEKIEIALRTKIIYEISVDEDINWLQNPNLFIDFNIYIKDLNNLVREIKRSKEVFIKHYKKTYSIPELPPAWISLEVTSMGLLSSLYSNLRKINSKKRIANEFGVKNSEIFASWIHALAGVRNICAHHGRLWNRRLTIRPQIPRDTKNKLLETVNIKDNKIYIQLSIIKYILDIISPNCDFNEKLKALFEKYTVIDEKEMGFPEDWNEEDLWN